MQQVSVFFLNAQPGTSASLLILPEQGQSQA